MIKAHDMLTQTGATENEITWAEAALRDPHGVALDLLRYVLAANAAQDVATITSASDSAIQNNVNTAVDVLAA